MAALHSSPPTLEKLYECAQTLSNAKGLVQNRVSTFDIIPCLFKHSQLDWNKAFNEKASSLVFVQACGCEPCLESKNLRLKIVAHNGNFAIKQIRNFEELAGEDVILTHRMLKNDIESNEYWLVTDNFYKDLSPKNKSKFSPNTQNLESFGKMKLNYLQLSTPEPKNSIIEKRSRLYNWFAQALYFSKAKFGKKSLP